MATYLELCQQALARSGAGTASSIPTVADATGFEADVVDFVREAWVQIQGDQENWLFMQEEFTADLVADQGRYTPADLGITSFRTWRTDARWYITDTAKSTITGGELPEISFQRWRGRQQVTLADQRPTYYAIHPTLDLLMTPTPDRAFQISGEYQIGIQTLTDDGDVPQRLPAEYHDIIKWKAINMIHGYDEAMESESFSVKQYAIVFNNIKRIYLPKTTLTPAIGADGYDDYRAGTVRDFFAR